MRESVISWLWFLIFQQFNVFKLVSKNRSFQVLLLQSNQTGLWEQHGEYLHWYLKSVIMNFFFKLRSIASPSQIYTVLKRNSLFLNFCVLKNFLIKLRFISSIFCTMASSSVVFLKTEASPYLSYYCVSTYSLLFY